MLYNFSLPDPSGKHPHHKLKTSLIVTTPSNKYNRCNIAAAKINIYHQVSFRDLQNTTWDIFQYKNQLIALNRIRLLMRVKRIDIEESEIAKELIKT